jgi:hypothetical protein
VRAVCAKSTPSGQNLPTRANAVIAAADFGLHAGIADQKGTAARP